MLASLLKRDEPKATPSSNADLARPGRTPVVRVRETADAILLDVDLPGVKADQLQLSVNDGVLTLHGRVATTECTGFQALHREYDDADFRRAFTLPDHVDGSAITANAKHGVVTITLPKAKAAQPRRIAVTVN